MLPRYRGTSFKVQGGSVIAAFFGAHNYVSEQFGNYVEYGTLLHGYDNAFLQNENAIFSFQITLFSMSNNYFLASCITAFCNIITVQKIALSDARNASFAIF